MANILTILPKNIEAIINIPDEYIAKLVQSILDKLVLIENDHYTLNLEVYDKIVRVNSTTIAEIIFEEYPLPIISYYQYSKTLGVNPELIDHINYELHSNELFNAAVRKDEVPTDNDLYLEDIIEFDDDDVEYMDEQSYVATEQILHNMMQSD